MGRKKKERLIELALRLLRDSEFSRGLSLSGKEGKGFFSKGIDRSEIAKKLLDYLGDEATPALIRGVIRLLENECRILNVYESPQDVQRRAMRELEELLGTKEGG